MKIPRIRYCSSVNKIEQYKKDNSENHRSDIAKHIYSYLVNPINSIKYSRLIGYSDRLSTITHTIIHTSTEDINPFLHSAQIIPTIIINLPTPVILKYITVRQLFPAYKRQNGDRCPKNEYREYQLGQPQEVYGHLPCQFTRHDCKIMEEKALLETIAIVSRNSVWHT